MKHIKFSNTNIIILKKIKIKWINWHTIPNKKQDLALLAIKFLILKLANIVLDFNILIRQKVYIDVVYNRLYKSMQFFWCYRYRHIMVWDINKKVYRY